jgi:hypothetical protein
MKMKKLLPLTLLLFFAGTASKYIYAAQMTKMALHWTTENPYATAAGVLAAKAVVNTTLHYFDTSEDWTDQRDYLQRKAAKDSRTQQLLTKIQPVAEEHGFKKIFIFAPTPDEEETDGIPQFALTRYGDELLLVIPHAFADGILTDTLIYWKEMIIHELGHAVANHPLYKRMLMPTVGSLAFRSHVALGIAAATGVTAFTPLASCLSGLTTQANPLYLNAASGCISSAVTGITYSLVKKALDHGCTKGLNALSRAFERSADAYVAMTATKQSDPTMLERYADGLEGPIDENFIEKGITHPPLRERVATARAAAQGLRKRLLHSQRKETHVD